MAPGLAMCTHTHASPAVSEGRLVDPGSSGLRLYSSFKPVDVCAITGCLWFWVASATQFSHGLPAICVSISHTFLSHRLTAVALPPNMSSCLPASSTLTDWHTAWWATGGDRRQVCTFLRHPPRHHRPLRVKNLHQQGEGSMRPTPQLPGHQAPPAAPTLTSRPLLGSRCRLLLTA